MAFGRKDPPPPPEWDNPVAWRVKDFADGWIVFNDKESAMQEARETGAAIQVLYGFTINVESK